MWKDISITFTLSSFSKKLIFTRYWVKFELIGVAPIYGVILKILSLQIMFVLVIPLRAISQGVHKCTYA